MSTKEPEDGVALHSIDKPSGGEGKEDWAATIVGLAILALALAGAIPSGVIF